MKILLLTDVPPCKEFSGALLTEALCKNVPADSLVCVAVMAKSVMFVPMTSDLAIDLYRLEKPRENYQFRLSFVSWAFSFFNELVSEKVRVPRLAKKIIAYGRAQGVDRVWCILQGQTMIRLSTEVATGLNVPLLTQIWDDPQWWFMNHKIDSFSSSRILSDFTRSLKSSACIGNASRQMSDQFNRSYGVPTTPFESCIDKEMSLAPRKYKITSAHEIVIGFAGQLYAGEAWESFMEALHRLRWEIGGRMIKVRVLGYHISMGGHRKWNVEFLGYRSQAETIQLLSECELLYCPYIFDAKAKVVAEGSFPAKLTTFLATGVPVFFHGPEYAAPAKFLTDYDAGFMCYTTDPEKVKTKLEQVFASYSCMERIAKNGSQAFHSCLTNDVQRDNFTRFLAYGDRDEYSATR